MTDTEPDPQPASAPSDRPAPDPALAGAGLSATGRTAGDLQPGGEAAGTAYGAPGGTGADDVETTGAAPADGADAHGDGDASTD